MQYQKIQTVYKRDPDTKYKTLLDGQFSLPEFEYLANNDWVFTEKVDGMGMRLLWNGSSVEFRGRTDKAQIPPKLFSWLQETITSEKMYSVFGGNSVCVYGEGFGAGIQKVGAEYGQDQKVVLFDVRASDWWLERDSLEDIATKLGIEIVPIVGTGSLYDMIDLVREGFKSQWGDFIAEGVVAKPAVSLNARDGSRIITKLKYKDFRRG